MNGAPAKPMRGTSIASAARRAASVMTERSAGPWAVRRPSAASSVTGSANTGPIPVRISTSTPATYRGVTMSEKKMPASTPWRRTGWAVISATRSGVVHASSIPKPARASRYSGRERPAWRMNHTGRRSGRSPR